MVLPALKRGGNSYRKQVLVGSRPGGGRHNVDLAAEKAGDEFLISIKAAELGHRRTESSFLR